MLNYKYVFLLVAVQTTLVGTLLYIILPSSPVHKGYGSDFTHQFIRLLDNVNLTGATVQPILNGVEWLEDLSNTTICNSSDPFILALVPSAIPNAKARQLIRKTWANPIYYSYTKIRAIFVVGATNNGTLQKAVQEEIDKYQDIIQYNVIDSYRNLTYKTLSWMSWVGDYCEEVPWIAKIDDDIVVNPFHLNIYLVNQFKKNPAPNEIHGMLHANNHPMRNGKWEVTKEEYPAEKYPPFVLGPAYIVGRNAIDRLLEYAPFIPFLWLEDVYITGMVAQAATIKRVSAESVLYTRKLSRKLYSGTVAFYIGANAKNRKNGWTFIMKYSPVKKIS